MTILASPHVIQSVKAKKITFSWRYLVESIACVIEKFSGSHTNIQIPMWFQNEFEISKINSLAQFMSLILITS